VDREGKRQLVTSLNRTFSEAGVVVVTRNAGLDAAAIHELRSKLRAAGASFKVAKNRLAQRALDGTSYKALGGLFKGPTGFASSKDPVAAAKAAVEFAKKNDKLQILGGALGQTSLDVNGVKALAELPSRDELRARLIGVIQAPAQKLASVIQAPAGKLARVFGAQGAKPA